MKSFKNNFDIRDAPSLVQYVYIQSYLGNSIGSDTYNEVLEKYPEWFPEESDHRNKWKSIPREVKDAYIKEMSAINDEIYKDYNKNG